MYLLLTNNVVTLNKEEITMLYFYSCTVTSEKTDYVFHYDNSIDIPKRPKTPADFNEVQNAVDKNFIKPAYENDLRKNGLRLIDVGEYYNVHFTAFNPL